MNKEKLMVVGAAKFTVPIIELSKKMGFETIVVSIAGNYPGFLVADRSYEVDVRDKETILEFARKEGICGIVTDQTDLPVPAVAYVAEEMGLPGIGYECALRITDKLKCRQHCREMGFPVPAFVYASRIEEAQEKAKKIGFPLVVKPTDSMAARGIAIVNNSDELVGKFQHALSCSANRVVLLEQFFHGKKIGVVGFKSGSQSTNLIMVDHDHFDIPNLFIVKQVLTPSLLDENLKEIIWDFHTRLFESLGASFGFTYSELRVNEEKGEFCLMEAAIRGPAGFVSSHLVPLACGVDVLPLFIELSTDRRENARIEKSRLQERAAGNVYFYLPAGVICRVEGVERVKKLPGVHRTELSDLVVGRKIDPLINLSGRQGPLVYAGKDRQACEEIIQRMKDILIVEVETAEGVKGAVWN
ncbi:MAG: ATP-grasp domain-containing protein [Deltaproteobacteria bacterium]|nr:ATP-grasp domain-containing protein [Deltaproteobacteria bacterium]